MGSEDLTSADQAVVTEAGSRPVADTRAEAESAAGFDLGAELDELAELFALPAALEEIAAGRSSPELAGGLADAFEEFKRGVDKQLGTADAETRYDLGIAYKQMGLIDDAIAQFQGAANDENWLFACASMLGLCFLEKGQPKLAVDWLTKGLGAPGCSESKCRELRYDLAVALEAAGEPEKALRLFTELYGEDANFRDVAARVRTLGGA